MTDTSGEPVVETTAAETAPPADVEIDEAAPSRRALSRRTRLILLVVAIVALILGALWFFRHETYGKYMQETNDAQIQADAVPISPRVDGYVAEVMVADNQYVARGQPLVRIDARDYRAQVAEARARIGEAGAGADNARASIAEQRAAITQASAQLAAAKAKSAHDAREVRRYAPLAASGAETREQLARLELAATQSADAVREQAAALEMQRRRIGTLSAQVRQSEAQAEGARAQLAAADVNLGAALLKAPIPGRVGDKTVTIGQYVQAGTRLMSVVPLAQLYVVANFKETQLALMRPGQPAQIEIDALGGIDINGRVASVSPGTGAQFSILPPQNATGNFTKIVQRVPVRIAIEPSPAARRLLVPGLSVNVTVDTRNAKGELDRISDEQDRMAAGRR